MYIAIANSIYSSTLQGSGGGFPKASFALNFNTIASDFTFTRNSFGTRVNEFGLIETVTDLGNDLVENGNFEELGSEIVTNGDFENGTTDWDFGGDWTLVNGTAEILTSTNSFLVQLNIIPLTVKTYKLQYEVVSTNGNDFRLAGGNSAFGSVNLDSATVGVKTFYLQSNGTKRNLQFNQNAFRGSIDNVSLKQVDPNDNWILGTNWIISNGRLSHTAGSGDISYQELVGITSGKTYILNYNVSGRTVGQLNVRMNATVIDSAVQTNGDRSITFLSNGNNRLIFAATNLFDGSIDNVSVQEILEDDVPRIDYTGSTFDVPVYGDELLTDGVISNVNGGIMTFTANGVNAVSDGTTGSTLRPRLLWNSLTVGKQYRIIGTPTVNSGTTNYAIYNGSSYEKNNVAVESFDITFTCGGSNVFFTNDGTQTFDIDWDLSIKEVTAYTTTDKGAFLLEPISTNLINYSEDFSNGSGWSKLGNSAFGFVTGVAPDGNTSVYEITSNGTGGKLQKNISGLSINTEYTLSFYAKQLSPTTSVSSRVLSQTGGSGGSNLIPVNYQDQLITDEWVRITQTFTTNDTLGSYIIYISNNLTGGESLQFWGAQLEELSYATSYIPTSGTTVTRAQETCVDATPTINSEEGVLYAEISALADDGTNRSITLNDGSGSNRVYLSYTSGSNRLRIILNNSSGTQADKTQTISSITDLNKIAFKYKENDFALWVNGIEVYTDTLGSTFPQGTLTELDFNNGSSGSIFYGRTKDLKIYDKALTDDELIELTTI